MLTLGPLLHPSLPHHKQQQLNGQLQQQEKQLGGRKQPQNKRQQRQSQGDL